MAAEPQLVEYIQKAKEAGQTEELTKALLLKNGWTTAEVGEALLAISQTQPSVAQQPQPQPQPQVQTQPQVKIPDEKPVSEIRVEPEREPAAAVQQPAQPVQQPQVQNPTVQYQNPTSYNSHLFLKLFVVLIILLVLGGAGVFVFLNFSNKLTPTKAVANMVSNMKNLKSYNAKTTTQIGITDSTGTKISDVAITSSSQNDISSASNIKKDVNFTVNVTPVNNGEASSVDAEAIEIGSTFYIKINSVALPAAYSMQQAALAQISGKWFKTDKSSLQSILDAESSGLDLSQLKAPQISQNIQTALLQSNILASVKQLGSNTVNGTSVYDYTATADQATIKSISEQLAGAGTNATLTNYADLIATALGNIDFHMLIGQKDNLLYGYSFAKTIDASVISSTANYKLAISSSTVNSNFNKAVSIQEPTSAQKVEEIVLPILKQQKIESDFSNINSIAQSNYTTEGNGYYPLCAATLLNGSDKAHGADLLNLSNDVVSTGATKPTCFAVKNFYCVSAQLTDGSSICVDRNGVIGKTKCVSAKTECK